MKSMTGFGKGESGTITVEIKSVNNRFLDINIRNLKGINSLDLSIRKLISQYVKRGNLDVYVTQNQTESNQTLLADTNLIKGYIEIAQKLNSELNIENDISFKLLTKLGAIKPLANEPDLEQIENNCILATQIALKNLNSMRLTEGKSIKDDLTKLIGQIEDLISNIKAKEGEVVASLKQKLTLRIEELLSNASLDQSRIILEAGILADKADINEELSRLCSHISQFKQEINLNEPQGRKLDFISQELNREINTIGSKSADIEISQIVVELKTILEKIKEQIRNIE